MAEKKNNKAFILDTMLGELARWLRLLGYDTLYSRVYSDNQILRIGEKTGRIIVTRDWGLYVRARKRKLKAIYISGDSIVERLAEMAIRAGIDLHPDPSKSRCPRCNSPLIIVKDKEKVKGKVPPKSYEIYDTFYLCPRCGMVYWEGGHWRNIRRIASEAESLAAKVRKARRPRGTRHKRRGVSGSDI